MGYCNVDDVKSVKSVQSLLQPNGNWSDADISAKIEEISDSVIDTALRKRYTTPITPVTDELKRICKLKTAFEMLQEEYGNIDGKWDYLNSEAQNLLRKLEEGELLINDDDTETPQFRGPRMSFGNNVSERFFNMEG